MVAEISSTLSSDITSNSGLVSSDVQVSIREPTTGKVLEGACEGVIVAEGTWPGITRTVYNNHQRYLNVYMTAVTGRYFFGDSASRDKDGHYWIQGRCDGNSDPRESVAA